MTEELRYKVRLYGPTCQPELVAYRRLDRDTWTSIEERHAFVIPTVEKGDDLYKTAAAAIDGWLCELREKQHIARSSLTAIEALIEYAETWLKDLGGTG